MCASHFGFSFISINNEYNYYSTLRGQRIYKLLLTKTTAAQNEVALSYHNVRGLYFLAVVL